MRNRWIVVEGQDDTPDGRHDYLLWEGRSILGAIRAARDGLRNDMSICVRIFLPHKESVK